MSNYQQRDNSGVLFKNDKGGNDARPDYRGEIMVNGEMFELAAWIKEGRNGKFMSLSAKPKEDRPQAQRPAQQPRPGQRQQPQRDMTPRAAHQQMDSHGFDDGDDLSDVPF